MTSTSGLRIQQFGSIDAESEDQLAEFFLRTDAYGRIEDQEHPIVVGRKGTGKTAIYKALTNRSTAYNNVHTSGLLFKNYPWGAHAKVADADAASVERYSSSWEFLILVELCKVALTRDAALVDNEDSHRAQVAVRKFVEANWGQVDYAFKDTFKRRKYNLHFEPKIAGTSLARLSASDVPRERLAGFLTEANDWLRFCLQHMLRHDQWYFILFDELDQGYDPSDRDYSDRLIGLLLASRSVFLWGRRCNLQVSPTVFIRSDIYDELSFPDKNKVSDNLTETLRWTDEAAGENSLKTLLDRRIKIITGEEDESDPWSLVFDPQVMRGTQPKHKHMAARTYLRPRDMIKFGNLCLDEAKRVGNARVENRDIARARPAYSRYLISELDDEMHEAVPEWRKYLDLLRRIHTLRFTRDEFERNFTLMKLGSYGRTADEVLEVLYDFSIIGFTKAGGSGYGGSAVAFRYQEAAVSFDPSARGLRVHAGLKEALDLVEAGEGG